MKNYLTIAIPIFNGAKYISQTLNSILKQKNVDIVISDNNSTDETKKILKKYSEKYSNIQINFNPTNIGFDLNLRKCVELCKTDYVWLLTDDDIIRDGAVETVNNIIKNNSNNKGYGLIYVDNLHEYNGIKEVKFGSDPNKFFEYTKFRSGGMSSNIINRKLWKNVDFKKYTDDWPHLVYSIIVLTHSNYYIHFESLKSEVDPNMPKRWLNNSSLFRYLQSLKKTFEIMKNYSIYSISTIKKTEIIVSKHISTAIIIEKKNKKKITFNQIIFVLTNSKFSLFKNIILLICPTFLYEVFKNFNK